MNIDRGQSSLDFLACVEEGRNEFFGMRLLMQELDYCLSLGQEHMA